MRLPITLAICLLWASTALAHEPASKTPVSGAIGNIAFPNSGAAAAQPDFIRGVLLLHSFEYLQARAAFVAAQTHDPRFALAWWGEAMSYNHTIWGEQDITAARAALRRLAPTETARAALAPTPRERGYMAAVERLYGEGSKQERDAAYSAALAELATKYPEDLNARTFYALSLIGLTGTRRDEANYMRAAAEAEAVYEIDRRHPGALHYLIHAYDDPVHAPLGLRAARLYGEVAPAASHAQHMPSHIFFALGLWDDAIEANLASLATARAQGEGGYHSLVWLAYAYFQQNRPADALPLIESVAHDVATNSTKDNRLRLAFTRAMWLAEAGSTAGADAMSPVDATAIPASGYFSIHDFMRGLVAARGGHHEEARAALDTLRRRAAALTVTGDPAAAWYENVTAGDIEQARLLAEALEATIRFEAGDRAGAIVALRAAITAADTLVFEYGPPWSVKPFDELLGEMLLADGQRDEAADAFRKTLTSYPKRRLALAGLAEATR